MPCLQGLARGDGCAARIVRPSSRSGNQRGEELLAKSIPEAGLVEEREVNRRIMTERLPRSHRPCSLTRLQNGGVAIGNRPGEGAEYHVEPELELVPEVVAGLENVFGCHLDEVRVGVCGELLHHRFGNVGGVP
jgi:hypothetical protein